MSGHPAPPGHQGMATLAKLLELHRESVASLTALVRDKPSAELLGVARAMLKDNGVPVNAPGTRATKRLQTLYELYVKRLAEALDAERPTAAMLAEARLFLQQQGVQKDLGPLINKATAAKALEHTALPFKAPMQ